MSFGFQLLVMVVPRTGYSKIFDNKQDDDVTYEKCADHGRWMYTMLHFNWLRFVEYSISGSLVLATIALISGIVDTELLICIFFLSAACMIFGLVAEWCMRVHTVLVKGTVAIKQLPGGEVTSNILERMLSRAFIVSHLMAWVCIAVPWYIIFKHYESWFNQCKSNSQPPEFVKYIVFLQIVLFTSFGIIQAVQWKYPHKRRAAEIAYISLSLTAKAFLGIILAVNVLMQD